MKVVIAIDLSPYTKHVIERVLKRHWPDGTQFKLVTVVEPISSEDLSDDDLLETVKNVMKHRQAVTLHHCQDARRQLQDGIKGSIVHIDIRHGNPREELIQAAAEWNADKIIIGAHGRDMCQRFLWGSVSRGVAMHCHCPVEIVRAAAPSAVTQPALRMHAQSK